MNIHFYLAENTRNLASCSGARAAGRHPASAIAPPRPPPSLQRHERGVHAPVGFGELNEATVVDDAVDYRRHELVVGENRAPLRELDVGGDRRRPSLIAARDHLE